MRDKSWLRRVGNCLSQLFNVVFLNGDEDETTSSRIGKLKVKTGEMPRPTGYTSFVLYIIHAILIRFPVLKGHFIKAIECDEGERC